jgi:hypothetical protein
MNITKVNIDAKEIDLHAFLEELLEENRPIVIFFQIGKSIGMVSTVMIKDNIRKDIKQFLEELPEPQ